jgi:histidyl-tRNA synthetase
MASTTSLPTERSVQELEADIAAQKAIFNDLRAHGAPLQNSKKQLADLQKTLFLVKGVGKEKEKKTEGSGGAQQQVDGQQQPKKKERLLLKWGGSFSSRLLSQCN